MSQATSIQWTDFSVNPFRARGVVGTPYEGHVGEYCEKVSPGCANCYASKLQLRFRMPEFDHRHKKQVELYLDGLKLLAVLKRRKPTKYFWCDMTDMFGEFYPYEWIDQVVATCAMTPHHTHQFLTKRIDRAREYFRSRMDRTWHAPNGEIVKLPFKNIWLGTSVENQETADERIPILMDTPASIRFISAEPLLGPINICQSVRLWRFENFGGFDSTYFGDMLNWVIVGGESGSSARPMHSDWTRGIRDQCVAANVAFFFKQWGSWFPFYDRDIDDPDWGACPKVDHRRTRYLNLAGGFGFHGERVIALRKSDKNNSGRTLDGREWNEFPVAA
jgi:protein gp37